MAKDKNGNDLHVGDLVAVRPNSGWYGKWRVAVVDSIDRDERYAYPSVRIKYKEPVLKNKGYVDGKIVLSKSVSTGIKSSADLVVIDPSILED